MNSAKANRDIVHSNGIAAEVRGGVSQGDIVIVYPPDSVSDGSSITSALP